MDLSDNMDFKFQDNGLLESKRCVQCHRHSKMFYFDSGGGAGLRSQCVSCAIQTEQKKKAYHRRYSESKPRFDSWGRLKSKICTKCKKRSKEDNFAKRVQGIGGRTSWCRRCVADHTKKWEKENLKKK